MLAGPIYFVLATRVGVYVINIVSIIVCIALTHSCLSVSLDIAVSAFDTFINRLGTKNTFTK